MSLTLLLGTTIALAAPLPIDPPIIHPGVQIHYFMVEPDPRQCPSPLCGGWFVDPLNRQNLTCPDGHLATRCYVGELDLAALDLTFSEHSRLSSAMAEDRLILEGDLVLAVGPGREVGRLKVSRAWEGQTGSDPSGSWALLKDNGRACLVAPCAHLDERLLNRQLVTAVAALDFDPSGATQAEVDAAWEATATDGLIVAGERYLELGVGSAAPGRTVTEFYTVFAP